MMRTNSFEVPLRTEIDSTSDPLYLYIGTNENPKALLTDNNWIVYRVTVESGTVLFANGNDLPVHQASEAVNYTY